MLRWMRTPSQQSGDAAEDLVAARLGAAGWIVLGRRVRVGRGELDLVAVDPGPPRELAIVEVRWRRRRDFGLAEETFDPRKAARVRRAALHLIERGRLPDGTPLPEIPLRIDLVAVEPNGAGGVRVRHHRHARGF